MSNNNTKLPVNSHSVLTLLTLRLWNDLIENEKQLASADVHSAFKQLFHDYSCI